MPINNRNAYKRRVKNMSTPVLKKEYIKSVRRISFDGTSCVLSTGSAIVNNGFAWVIAAVSAFAGCDDFEEYEILRDELVERGEEAHLRKRDILVPVSISVGAEVAVLMYKS